jgi:hypothetical protein
MEDEGWGMSILDSFIAQFKGPQQPGNARGLQAVIPAKAGI